MAPTATPQNLPMLLEHGSTVNLKVLLHPGYAANPRRGAPHGLVAEKVALLFHHPK